MPRVSVIIPSYNCARYLGRAIDSVCAQTYKDYEILLVDDGSTDDTKDVAMQYGRKLTYLYQQNRGVSAARNHAISKASGELLAYLDADDMWYAEKLERQVAFLDVHKECGMLHSEISVIKPPHTTLQYAWIIAVWTPVFTQYQHAFLKKRLQQIAGSTTAVHEEISVGQVIQAAIQDGVRGQAVIFPEHTYLDIGTPENLFKAVEQSTKHRQ